jgi:hypothetical protein
MGYNAKYTFSALTIFEEIHKHNSNILHLNLSYFVTAPLQAPISICCFILVCGIMSHSFFFCETYNGNDENYGVSEL